MCRWTNKNFQISLKQIALHLYLHLNRFHGRQKYILLGRVKNI
jgi:hypothetical protein